MAHHPQMTPESYKWLSNAISLHHPVLNSSEVMDDRMKRMKGSSIVDLLALPLSKSNQLPFPEN